MMAFTDMTGLASIVIAITATAVALPGAVRLSRFYRAGLACAVAVVFLIPFGGLSPAAYVRGVTGDLSITTQMLLMLAILGGLRGVSITPTSFKEEGGRPILLLLIAIAALFLYPMALGMGMFDPYRLGYGDPWFLGALLIVALSSCFLRLWLPALGIALAVSAWALGWLESPNLWDYLLDPLLAVYALGALLKRGMRIYMRR
ncbi:MAG: hypothetical protein HY306_00720 [Nitrosomonadales bacterium]|nr:hypothetical protein [Nitrosomonadales bacterium]